MAVDPEYLDEIAATVAQLYREAETALAQLIAKHLDGDLDADMPAPVWAERKLAAVRALRASAQAVLAGLQADSSAATRQAAAEAFRAGWSSALAELPARWFPHSGLSAAAKQAAEEVPGFGAVEALAAAVHADVGQRSRNVLRDVVDVYRGVIAAATARTLTGTQTRRQAAQAAWQRFVDRGITGFTDRAGRRWRLSSYVEMATRTVAQRAAVQGQTDRLHAAGVSLVYVSNAPQECVLCRPFEGRVLRLGTGPTGRVQVPHQLTDAPVEVEVVDTLAGAQLAGLFHPNCRHSVSAFLPGVTKPPPQPTADPEGDKARQRQRAIEREIRKHKQRQAVALDEPARKAASQKVRAWQAEMREHLDAHPELKRLRYREQLGAGNVGKPGTRPAGEVAPLVDVPLDGGPPQQRKPHQHDAERDVASVVNDPGQLDLLGQRRAHRDEQHAELSPERRAEPVPELGPAAVAEPAPPEPGEAGLARLLDVDDELTADELLNVALTAEGEERREAFAALARFEQLAEEGSTAPGFASFVKRLAKHADPVKYVRRRLGQQRDPAARAATLRALWSELEARAQPGWALPGSSPALPGMRAGLRFDDNGEAVKWAMKNMPLPGDLTKPERESVSTYTGSAYREINNALRGYQPANSKAWLDRIVGHLDKAFAKAELAESILAFRGSGPSILSTLGADINDPKSIAALVGSVHTDGGYLSTSIGSRAAFGGAVVFAFRIPTGARAMNVMPISKFGTSEREILLNRGTRYVIHAAYQRRGTWYIECEVVPDGWNPPANWQPDPYNDVDKGYR
ncbi:MULTISPECIES: phage minor capsid protein [Bacteria]|uniref:ADP-ribosyltransferase exoenzyme n=2 Tax=Bacteria TaxID=2 RepID=A0A1I4UK12_9BURK|nr:MULTISPECIES: phage minor capsid protein [Bacteria]SFE68593.1 ADP-ribosyltransferase exoenzyme [Saccharopolyspora kobensis]SFM89298.1 ADP-ribosyltransferase exoenzyme [Rugamonas rubra]